MEERISLLAQQVTTVMVDATTLQSEHAGCDDVTRRARGEAGYERSKDQEDR